ncbi:hypothetical protein F5X98DRAFT_389674 [Xylaria grammica]|nr:hypothetical protein F5X98DRAFT_389674 [Xylaria grammica]
MCLFVVLHSISILSSNPVFIINPRVLIRLHGNAIMPPRRHRLDGPRDDLWKENETTLRRLYLKEHRTLKDVKKVMESEHGFPTTPLSTYESKLRDLGLRKKMKRKDWYPVYQHYVNSGNRHTAMYFNGTRIPWDKAWKEIRRSGARESIEGSAAALPTDVIMRTPSPALVAQNFLPLYYRPPIPWHLSDAPLVGLSLEAKFLRLRLYDIPSNLLRIEMLKAGPLDESVDVILNQTPKYILLKMLERNSPTVRASVETLVKKASDLGRKDDFRNMIEAVARRHPEWVVGDRYLRFTARVGCPGEITAHEIFCSSLHAVAGGFYTWTVERFPIDLGNPVVSQTLNWFLDAGADVDLPVRFYHRGDLSYIRYTPLNWRPTILDHLFFENIQLYSHLVGRSTKFVTELTRSGVYLSAEKGIDSLRTYLLSRSHTPAQQDAFVDTLLAEELLRRTESRTSLDFDVIQTLLHHNIGLPEFLSDLNASVMLYCVVKAAVLQGVHPTVHNIIKILIHKGAVIGVGIIDRAVETKGAVLLQILSSYGADFRENGAFALCTAAQLNNYGAVNLLLNMGVDINAPLGDPNKREDSTILAQVCKSRGRRLHKICGHRFDNASEYLSPVGSAMLEYLVSRKSLGVNSSDTSRQQFLLLTIKHIESVDFEFQGRKEEILQNFQQLFCAELWTPNPSITVPCPLEALFQCELRDHQVNAPIIAQIVPIIEFMLGYGVPIGQSGVLAHLIYNGVPRDKVQRVLDSGVDINAYSGQGLRDEYVWRYTPMQAAASNGSLEWIQFLLQMGADVNQPARGYCGRTALQAACNDGRGEIDLVKFLVENGADGGWTALQAAAERGDFAVAVLLLENGANINAPNRNSVLSALDEAAGNGKLDMVQFLLDLGAFSGDRGESGYRGAIRRAENKEYWVVADIIRQHALKNGKSGEELSIHSSEWKGNSSSECSSDL